MMKILCGLILGMLSAGVVLAQANDWLIVPGQRLGPITSKSNRADLDRLFGKSNVKDQAVDTGNGAEPATVVYSSSQERAPTVLWYATRIIDVLICFPESTSHCNWHTDSGVTLGTPIENLEPLNCSAFKFVIWGSDAGGSVASWEAGKLAPCSARE